MGQSGLAQFPDNLDGEVGDLRCGRSGAFDFAGQEVNDAVRQLAGQKGIGPAQASRWPRTVPG